MANIMCFLNVAWRFRVGTVAIRIIQRAVKEPQKSRRLYRE